MSKAGFSVADLQKGAKGLHSATPSSSGSKDTKDTSNEEAKLALEELYEKYNGDLDLIFGELKADPSKAKKPHHRPKNAKEFATKYLEGFYSLVDDVDATADSKSHK